MKIKNGIERELGKIMKGRLFSGRTQKNEKLESVKGKNKEKIPPKLMWIH